jgi:hypothetical protein
MRRWRTGSVAYTRDQLVDVALGAEALVAAHRAVDGRVVRQAAVARVHHVYVQQAAPTRVQRTRVEAEHADTLVLLLDALPLACSVVLIALMRLTFSRLGGLDAAEGVKRSLLLVCQTVLGATDLGIEDKAFKVAALVVHCWWWVQSGRHDAVRCEWASAHRRHPTAVGGDARVVRALASTRPFAGHAVRPAIRSAEPCRRALRAA